MGDDHSTATHCPQPALVACMRSRPYAPSQYFPVLTGLVLFIRENGIRCHQSRHDKVGNSRGRATSSFISSPKNGHNVVKQCI
ncbi:hypothetical protein K439DRAFT_446694 [Ramaria rubella]|nr:hypothetical protein K439DRAFT_446694 [Ramaria rubella]